MDFLVLSRALIKAYSTQTHDKLSVLISIKNSFDPTEVVRTNRENNIGDVLYLSFDDITGNEKEYIKYEPLDKKRDLSKSGYFDVKTIETETYIDTIHRFTYEAYGERQAKKVVDFYEKWKDEADTFIVQCEAGRSRSAGICAALMKDYTGSDQAIYGNPYFSPNGRCYRLTLNELERRKETKDTLLENYLKENQ